MTFILIKSVWKLLTTTSKQNFFCDEHLNKCIFKIDFSKQIINYTYYSTTPPHAVSLNLSLISSSCFYFILSVTTGELFISTSWYLTTRLFSTRRINWVSVHFYLYRKFYLYCTFSKFLWTVLFILWIVNLEAATPVFISSCSWSLKSFFSHVFGENRRCFFCL